MHIAGMTSSQIDAQVADSMDTGYQREMPSFSVRIDLRVTLEQAAEIDRWRRLQDDLPTRQEAVRRLVQASLDAGPKTEQKTAGGQAAQPQQRKPKP
jgi:hypothetical protein